MNASVICFDSLHRNKVTPRFKISIHFLLWFMMFMVFCTFAFAAKPFHPGNYVLSAKETELPANDPVFTLFMQKKTSDNVTKAFRGLQRCYFWSDLETSQDHYDFTKITNEIGRLTDPNQRLVIQFSWKCWTGTGHYNFPDYIKNNGTLYGDPYGGAPYSGPGYYTTPGGELYPFIWNPNVMARLDKMFDELGKFIATYPDKIEAVNLPETAISDSPNLPHVRDNNYKVYSDAIVYLGTSMKSHLPNTQFFFYCNFPRASIANGSPLLKYAQAFRPVGIGWGGPDVHPNVAGTGDGLVGSPGNPGTYDFYWDTWGNLAASGLAVDPTYRDLAIKGAAVQTPDYNFSATPVMSDLNGNYINAKDKLHLNYLFWEARTSAAQNNVIADFVASKVSATNKAGSLNTVNPDGNDTTPPARVTNVTADTTHANQIKLSWTDAVDADYAGVQICRSTVVGGPAQGQGTVHNVAKGIESWLDSGRTPGVPYYYNLYSYDNATVPNYSAAVNMGPLTAGAVMPLPWVDADISAPTPAGYSSYLNNVYTVCGSGTDIWASPDQFHFVYQPISGDGTIIARVASQGSTGGTNRKAGIMIRESLAGSSRSAQIFHEGTNNGYRFHYRSTEGQTTTDSMYRDTNPVPYWVKLTRAGDVITAYISSNGTSWGTAVGSVTMSNLAGTIYVGLCVCSNQSGTLNTATFDNVSVTVVPAKPQGLTELARGNLGNLFFKLGWDANTEAALTGYNIYRSTNAGGVGGYVKINPALVAEAVYPEYTDNTLASGTTYYYTVTAVCEPTNESPQSDPLGPVIISDTTPPAAPANLHATSAQNNQVVLAWNNNTEGDLAGYNVYRTTDENGNFGLMNTSSLITSTSYTDTSVSNGMTYDYIVAAVDVSLNESSPTYLYSVTVVDTIAPAVPTGLAATAGDQQVSLDWADNSEGDLSGYNVYRSTLSASGYGKINPSLRSTSDYTDTGLINGVTYYYKVSAVDNAATPNESAQSSSVWKAPNGLLTPWLHQDIGTVSPTGSAIYDTGIYTISGAGADIYGTADNFQFAFQSISGDCEIVARLASQGATGGTYRKAGIMIRESTAAGAPSAQIFHQGTVGNRFHYRLSAGASTTNSGFSDSNAPGWLKLSRAGDLITAYTSTNGTSWTQVGSQSITMSSPALVGLCVCSNLDGTLNTSTFDNVTINHAPVITEGSSTSVTMSEDGSPTAFSKMLNATDADGNTITWSLSSEASHGTASVSGTGASKAISYSPNPNYNGTDSFIVMVSDGSLTDTITVNVTISAVNDAPVITEGTSVSVTMSEDGSPTAFSKTLNATDADADTITWSISSQAAHGTASASGTGASKAIAYTPAANYNGSDSFIVQVSDGNGGTDTITVNVTISAVNDAPVITEGTSVSVTMSEDGSPTAFSRTLNATDADADTITWSISSQAAHGTASASGTGASKAIAYTPTSNYNGSDSFIVQVSDGNGGTDTITVNVTISAVNDAPYFSPTTIPGSDATQGQAYTGSIARYAFDVDSGDTRTFSKVAGPAWLTVASNGALSGTPGATNVGLAANSFTVRVTDSNSAYANATLNINVQGLVTFYSNSPEDGYLRELNETSNTGAYFDATMNTGYSLRFGDNTTKQQLKGLVSFATDSLPDNATILSAKLRLKCGGITGTNPFNWGGTCKVDLRNGGFNGSTALENADFEAASSVSNVCSAGMSSVSAANQWSEGIFTTGLGSINKQGRTQLRVYMNLDDNNDAVADYIGFYSGETTAGSQPELVITYSMP